MRRSDIQDSRRRHDTTNVLDSQLSRYRLALTRLAEWGIQVHAASRLRQYERRLAAVLEDPSPGLLITEDAGYSLSFDLREIDEICEIVESFSERPDDGAMERIALLPAGMDDPDEEANAAARDAQYELLLCASLLRGGLVATLSEPDVELRFEGGVYFLEAKRPKSLPRLDDRLHKAVKQLKGKGPSVVAISMDLLVRPSGQLLHSKLAGDFSGVVAHLALTLLGGQVRAIANRVRGTEVAALVFTTRVPGFVLDTRMATLGTHVHAERLVRPAAGRSGLGRRPMGRTPPRRSR